VVFTCTYTHRSLQHTHLRLMEYSDFNSPQRFILHLHNGSHTHSNLSNRLTTVELTTHSVNQLNSFSKLLK